MDRSLLTAAVLFAGATAYGAGVGAREEVPGEPFGWRMPGRVAVHQALGYGSGTMAPWPMPVTALVAALLARPEDDRPARVCLAIGATVLAGTLVEPVTWARRPTSRSTWTTVALNLASGAALVVSGGRALRTADAHRR